MNRDARKYKQIKNLYIFGNLWSNGVLERQWITSIDIAFIAVTILTVISFVTKTESINAFHYVFVQVGMAVVYFFIRSKKWESAKVGRAKMGMKIPQTPFMKGGIIVGIGFIVAIIGLIQFAMGKPVVSTFGRTSFLGCFLAMNAAIALGTLLNIPNEVTLYSCSYSTTCPETEGARGRNEQSQSEERKPIISIINVGILIAFVVILGVVILTKSRTAMIAMAVVLPIMIFATKARRLKEKKKSVEKKELKTKLYKRKSVKLLLCLGVLVALFLVFNIGKAVYRIRPMSASGRVLIWKVSAEMFRKNPISGVGFGNFANQYNLYQAEYFASGKGSVINKMTAGQIRHAYNWYLETAVEFGALGLIVFGMFWWLILKEIFKTFKNIQYSTRNAQFSSKEIKTDHGLRTTPAYAGHADYVTLGMAGEVLCFMIMSLFQFPRMIIPTYLLFNIALAWIVNTNE